MHSTLMEIVNEVNESVTFARSVNIFRGDYGFLLLRDFMVIEIDVVALVNICDSIF